VTTDPVERLILAPEERRQAVLNIIDSARDRLALSVFRCDDEPVLDALAAAVRRGVHVRALLTGRAKGWKGQLKQLQAFLEDTGADVRRYADQVVRYHAKYIVADEGPAFIASLNFTRKCFQATCDFAVVSHDSELVDGVTRLFDADWDATRYTASDVPGHRLIVGPEQTRRRFTALFEEATHDIRIIDPKINDPAMMTLLRARAAAGITVDIRGAEALGPLVPHGKLIMIDDATAVIGSISLSTLALDFRRELAVVIRDRASLIALEQFWASLPPVTGGASAVFSGEPPHLA
jgi:phosphatidylserine/phosphatidylglycerophosphate/cardiolipin synthase-like enzyme